MGDLELLLQYVNDRATQTDALAQLIRRHAGWVHGVAARRLRDAQLAEDATQEVFLILATTPPRLREEPAVAAWLLKVTCHVTSNLIRAQVRQRRRERAFAAMHQEATEPGVPEPDRWQELSPHLD